MLNFESFGVESIALNSSLAELVPGIGSDQTALKELIALSSFSAQSSGGAASPTYGTDAEDILIGDSDTDQLYGRRGCDVLYGVAGDDTIFGNQASDWLWGGQGHDFLNGGQGDDALAGGLGQDSLVGGSGDDWLWGNQGDDTLKGSSGRDRLWGEVGRDRLEGGTGQDFLYGGHGEDILIDSDGGDVLTGGPWADEFWLCGGTLGPTKITDFQVGRDRIKLLNMNLAYDDLTLKNGELGAVISAGDIELAQLAGVDASQLVEKDFIFGNAKAANELQAVIEQVLQTTHLPGATAAVAAPDDTVWIGAGGVSELIQEMPMGIDDRFQIGSVTKPMVATVALQLVQEGRLSLEDTLTDWLPTAITDGLEHSQYITLRHLLNHTSGIPDFDDVLLSDLYEDQSLGLKSRTNEEILAQYVYAQPSLSAPGKAYSYSNTNYLLVGEIVETVSNTSLAKVLRKQIFEPLGMQNSFFSPQESIPGGYTYGYFDGDQNGMPSVDVSALNPSFDGDGGHAGIVSTARDVARFTQGLLEGELLAPETLKQMTTNGVPVGDGTFSGLGIFLDPQGYTVLFHGGSWLGWSSQLLYLPNQDTTISVITNFKSQASSQPEVKLLQDIGLSVIDNFKDYFVEN
ncbi:serine hydrolase [Nodosilinea sp. LEGE 07088]|uniref:serine hydrolase n=1 Tax=Nodosilinea sp. LEGE 07088 TaxID=2777968 RepID=UPI0018816091|nr:serine hydrolase [Nodosilinea sp. LEGE 07088]MBE9140820.1 serine hydrolase [Nodosilinea sp. LEGE 07088]